MSDQTSDSSGTAVAEPISAGLDGGVSIERRILLVDAASLFLQFEETLLQRKGYSFFRATSGRDALAILETEHVDLVIMDYALPDMPGDDLVRRVRSNPRTSESTAVLIVTARGMRAHVDACVEAGCSGFLFKPVSKTALCDRVQELLRVPVRRYVRTLVRLQVDARSTGRFLFGNSLNLSASGLLLQTEADLDVGEMLALRFFLPGDPEVICPRARVVRRIATESGSPAYGIAFDDLGRDEQSRIDAFVDTRRSGDAAAS